MASTASPTTLPPRLHVTANLPPVISFSSTEEPQLEMHITLHYSQPIIIALRRSRLWPLNLQSALTLTMPAAVGESILQHKDEFLGLTPGETSVVRVSFRPHNEPYDYGKLKNKGLERYRMLFPIGMQFLKPGEEYEIGIQQVGSEGHMVGDLEGIMSEDGEGAVWKPADGALEIVPGKNCRFRVEA